MTDKDNTVAVYRSQAASMIFEPESMDSMLRLADMMSKAKVQVPDHFKGNPADCLAVIMQAVQWQMNPFVVAQKTFITQGKLGYEAQLVNAVASSCGAFAEEPEFEFIGNWNKIIGKVVESEGKGGGRFYVAGWEPKDEEGLGVICSAKMGAKAQVRSITVMMSQCYPRFSTQWATDPQQQITYAAIKKLVRRYAPAAILGVYTEDDLSEQSQERDITPPKPQQQARPTEPEQLPEYPQEKFVASMPKWKALIASGKTTEGIIKTVSSKFRLTKQQLEAINNLNEVIESAEVAEFIEELGDE